MASPKGSAPTKKEANSNAQNNNTGLLDKAISSIWMEGPEKSKSVPDTFGKDVDKILGEFKAKTVSNLDTLFKDAGKKGKGLFDKFMSKFDLKKFGINKDSIKKMIDYGKKIANAAQEGMKIYQEFKDGNYGAVLDKMGGVLGSQLVNMGKYGLEMRDLVKNSDFHSMAGIMDFVKNATGVDMADALHINDIQAKIGSLVNLAQKYGHAGALSKLREAMFGKDFGGGLYPGLEQALATNLALNASFSQIDTIDEILMIIDGRMAGEINPDLIKRILRNYRLPTNWKEDSLEQEKERLFRIFEKIMPNWDIITTEHGTYLNLDHWTEMSDDAARLFGSDARYGVPVAIACNYRSISLRQGLNQTYPYLQLAY